MQTAQKAKPWKRVAAIDVPISKELLQAAAFIEEGEGQTQRQVFEILMPELYNLRNKGFSWRQLSGLLVKCGIDLQPSTVRTYFGELLEPRLDALQKTMNEQLIALAQIRKEAVAEQINVFKAPVNDAAQRARAIALERLNASSTKPQKDTKTEAEVSKQLRPAAIPKTGERPLVTEIADQKPTPVPSKKQSNVKATLDVDRSQNETPRFKCRPLQKGVGGLDKRPNVPDTVYAEGNLEHPAIPGLILSRSERLYGAYLEYTDDDGEIKLESVEEKQARVIWQIPFRMQNSASSKDFVTLAKDVLRSASA